MECEEKLLTLIFKDLAARSGNDTITIKTFETLFNSNTLWSRSLFKKFAGPNSDTLTLNDFIKGIIHCFSMDSEEEKIKFLFDLYDVNGNGTISYNEFLAIVNLSLIQLFSFPQEEMKLMLK